MFDVTLAGAGFAGLLSFLSPCILPIVPFYLSYLAGVGAQQLAADAPIDRSVRMRAFLSSVLFALGVITVFMGLGATASLFGQLVRDWFDVLRWLAAGLIIVMGLHFLGMIRIGFLYRQFRADVGETSNLSLIGAFVIGMAFAFGWTPCVGPVLAAILFTAAGTETASQGAGLLLAYGAGMTLPFILASLFIGPFLKWMRGFRRHLGLIEKVMGVMLIVFGLLIATNSINYIAQAMLAIAPDLGILR